MSLKMNCSSCSRSIEDHLPGKTGERLIGLLELECRTRIPLEELKQMAAEGYLPIMALENGQPLFYWSDTVEWLQEVIDHDWEKDDSFEPTYCVTEPLSGTLDVTGSVGLDNAHSESDRHGRLVQDEPLLTGDEVARRMQVHPDSIGDMANYGGLTIAKFEEHIDMYRWSDVIAWLQREVIERDWVKNPLPPTDVDYWGCPIKGYPSEGRPVSEPVGG